MMTAQGDGAGQEGAIVTRFAPSPTGRLHLGHALSAVRAHDLARAGNGRFLLRIEDIDGTRSRPKHVAGIVEDVAWLGLGWDELSFQSERLPRYEAALERLRGQGLLYRCFCTRADIAAALSAPHAGEGSVYPGTCRHLAAEDSAVRSGEPHAWRLDVAKALAALDGAALTWRDVYAGTIVADPLSHGDVVLARKDAPASYHLAVTVDDAAQGVTDVVRGRDLFEATHVHRLLQALLGLPTPLYHHHPLITDAAGQRLAKRHGAPTLAALRERGVDGARLADDLRAGRLPIGFALANA